MKERPIIFTSENVLAIKSGIKTQTRRLKFRCEPGDILWVKESWKPYWWEEDGYVAPCYKADGEKGGQQELFPDDISGDQFNDWWMNLGEKLERKKCPKNDDGNYIDVMDYLQWSPAIFMPKSMSRFRLTVIHVRREKLQDITETDAIWEGAQGGGTHPDFWAGAFRDIWDGINKKRGYGWETNPAVEVIDFERNE
jgi:hypothetical protein